MARSRAKKSSQHADVIDRLDFTGVGCMSLLSLSCLSHLSPVFHHDGPFDACAPSRNKHRNKAPMYAWSGSPDPAQYGDGPYPHLHPDPPKKKVDAIAEAWGIHEPEPYEEFFAGGGSARPDGDTPASSIYNGRDSHATRTLPKRPRDDLHLPKELHARTPTRRPLAPPPQPIFVPDSADLPQSPSSSSSPTGLPKRQKSLMQRIRKMRDAPNVPVNPHYDRPLDDYPLSPARPAHKPHNSLLGRFAPKSPDPSEPFLLIDPIPSNKDLPPSPPALAPTTSTESEFGGINRKTSIMKKVGRVVRGNK